MILVETSARTERLIGPPPAGNRATPLHIARTDTATAAAFRPATMGATIRSRP